MMERLIVFILSALPVSEWRGAVLVSILQYKISVIETFFITLIGSLLPALLIIYLAGPVLKFIEEKLPRLGHFVKKILDAIGRSKQKFFVKLKEPALILLSALPIPIIGGTWTAAAASFIFGIKPKKAFPLIALGTIIGIILMISLTLAGKATL